MIFQLLWVNPPLGFYYQKVVLRTRPLPTHTGVKCSLNYSYIFSARNCLSHSILHRHPPLCSCVRAHHSWLYPYLHSHLHQICCGSTYTWTFLLSFRDPEDHLWRVFLKQVRAHRVWREAHHLKASIHLLYIGVHAWSRRILRRVQPALFFCRSYRISDSHRVE